MRFSPAFLAEIRARAPASEVARAKAKLKKEGREKGESARHKRFAATGEADRIMPKLDP